MTRYLNTRKIRQRLSMTLMLALTAAVLVGVGWSALGDELDPARNLALPCELVSTPGQPPRSARNIVHVANVCGFVGTDIEFQSRKDAQGTTRHYAFVGTMGAGTRIFEITDPAHPRPAGGYADPGWQNDVHVRGNLLVVGFDWLIVGANVSACLKEKNPVGNVLDGGFDAVRLVYDPQTGNFRTETIGCFLSEQFITGTHTVTIHPSGKWISSNSSIDGIEVVDAVTLARVRHIPTSIVDSAHDVSFSSDGNTLYSAGVASTRIVDVTDVFNRAPTLVATVPNAASAEQGGDGQNIEISHQSDTSADGKFFVVTDEAGGGLLETACNQGPSGKIGAAHFWALAPIDGVAKSAGASPSTPKKVGTWLYPNPTLAQDPIGRVERACSIHVFRIGGNGGAGPGAIQSGFDGKSRLPSRQLVAAHYGAGVWHIDFSGPASSTDGIAEDPRATWGNTLGWSVMPGAETWSAKEYKGFIYTGDMGRGFDVFGFTKCAGASCVSAPVNTPGRVTGYGETAGEPKTTFRFNVAYEAGRPTGALVFYDNGRRERIESSGIDTLVIDPNGKTAVFTGTATIGGTPDVRFTVRVEDAGSGSSDTFTITFDDYVLTRNGEIQITRSA